MSWLAAGWQFPTAGLGLSVRHVRHGPMIGAMSDTTDTGQWVSVAEAARLAGCSTRTIERRITSGQLQGRIDGGRRLVLIETAHRHQADGVSGLSDSVSGAMIERAQAQASALAVMSDRLSGLAEGRVGDLQRQASRARAFGLVGWSVAAVLAVLAGGGAVWGVQRLEVLRGQAAAAEAVRGILADQARADREQLADLRHRAELAELRATTTGRITTETRASGPVSLIEIP